MLQHSYGEEAQSMQGYEARETWKLHLSSEAKPSLAAEEYAL